jgi:hypothetical protein
LYVGLSRKGGIRRNGKRWPEEGIPARDAVGRTRSSKKSPTANPPGGCLCIATTLFHLPETTSSKRWRAAAVSKDIHRFRVSVRYGCTARLCQGHGDPRPFIRLHAALSWIALCSLHRGRTTTSMLVRSFNKKFDYLMTVSPAAATLSGSISILYIPELPALS